MLGVKGGDEEKQHRLAKEVSPEERVRAGEVLEGSSVMGGFCSKLRGPVLREGGKIFFVQGFTDHYCCFLPFSYYSFQLGEDT